MSKSEASLELQAEQQMLRPMRNSFKIQKTDHGKFKVTIDEAELSNVFQGMFRFFILAFDALDSPQSGLGVPMLDAIRLLKVELERLVRPPTTTEIQNLNAVASQIAFILEQVLNEGIGIPPSLSISSIDTAEFAQLVKDSGSLIGAYNTLLERDETFSRLQQRWEKSEILGGRFAILEKALRAHRSGDHELSIPIFLIHIESLFGSMKVRKPVVRNVLAGMLQTPNLNMNYFLRDSFMTIVVNEILRSERESQNDFSRNFPNRHEVIHGKNLEYFRDPLNSTRCLIVLDGLTGIDLRQFGT